MNSINRLPVWLRKLTATARLAGCLLVLVFSTGCAQISYYAQSVSGHTALMLQRKKLDSSKLVASPALMQNLALSQQMLDFAQTDLGLPATNSYRTYIDLKRDYPVWTVVAAPEFSLEAKQWCYLVIGCASYRGYFRKEAALKYAEQLEEKGLETYVSGAPAYSTLGWFADPLLPTMFAYGEAYLAETLFHELAHQRFYWKGESALSEGFATLVGELGAQQWLAQNNPQSVADYHQSLQVRDEFYDLLLSFQTQLTNLYNSERGREEMVSEKIRIFASLQKEYLKLKMQRWNGQGWYDSWFSRKVNNARLAGLATYRNEIAKLHRILIACGEDLNRFYSRLEKLRSLDHADLHDLSCGLQEGDE